MILNDIELQILEDFTGNYSLRATGSSIAKKKKLNQKTVSNYLKGLEEQNLLKSITEGRNRIYFLNLADEQIISNFISLVENAKTIAFYKAHPLIKEIVGKSLPFINGPAVIFGSYAKGTQVERSDLDIFVAGNTDAVKINKIANVYNIDIQVQNYPLSEFKKTLLKNDPLIEEIIKNHVIIQGTNEFVSALRKIKYGKN
jgi:uncharacterized protein